MEEEEELLDLDLEGASGSWKDKRVKLNLCQTASSSHTVRVLQSPAEKGKT